MGTGYTVSLEFENELKEMADKIVKQKETLEKCPFSNPFALGCPKDWRDCDNVESCAVIVTALSLQKIAKNGINTQEAI